MSGKLVYIDSVIQALDKAYGEGNLLGLGRILNNVSAVDAVEVDTVAEMLYRAIGDRYACNVNDNDEWLSEVCELQEQCPHPKDLLGCWKQFVKHYCGAKMEGGESKNE